MPHRVLGVTCRADIVKLKMIDGNENNADILTKRELMDLQSGCTSRHN